MGLPDWFESNMQSTSRRLGSSTVYVGARDTFPPNMCITTEPAYGIRFSRRLCAIACRRIPALRMSIHILATQTRTLLPGKAPFWSHSQPACTPS